MHIDYADVPVTLAGGETVTLRKPSYSITELGFGPLHPKTMLSPRVAPPMIGLGLIEAIPEAAIRAGADPDDADKDGISGRANEVWSVKDDRVMLGRFGWKAGNPTIRQQSADAAAGDIGLSNSLAPRPAGDCTATQTACLGAPNGNSERSGGYELGDDLMDLVVFYAQNLAVPARRGADKPEVLAGKGIVPARSAARAATRRRIRPASSRASRSSATSASGPIRTSFSTTWAKGSPTTGPRAWRTGASGARRRCGASASPRR